MSSVLGRLRLVGGLAGAVVVALLAIAAAMAGAQNDAVRAREFWVGGVLRPHRLSPRGSGKDLGPHGWPGRGHAPDAAAKATEPLP
jgi:hypothetical protein